MSRAHYSGVIISMMASQITSLTIVYSIVYSSADKKKPSKLRVTGLCAGNSQVTGEFPAQRASNEENVSIWWRYHGCIVIIMALSVSSRHLAYVAMYIEYVSINVNYIILHFLISFHRLRLNTCMKQILSKWAGKTRIDKKKNMRPQK